MVGREGLEVALDEFDIVEAYELALPFAEAGGGDVELSKAVYLDGVDVGEVGPAVEFLVAAEEFGSHEGCLVGLVVGVVGVDEG